MNPLEFETLLNRGRMGKIFGGQRPTYDAPYNPPVWNGNPAELPEEATRQPSYLDQFRESLAARPVREEPSMKRRIFGAIGGGVTALGDEGAAGGRAVNRAITEGPYLRKMSDWQGKTANLGRMADIERGEETNAYNRMMGERKFGLDKEGVDIQRGELEVKRGTADTSRRVADSNIRMDDAQIAKIENEIKTGNTHFLGEANGSFWVLDKKTNKTTSIPTGGMTDEQKKNAQEHLMQIQLDAGRYGDKADSANQESAKIALNLSKLLTDPASLAKYGKFIDMTDPQSPRIDPTKVGRTPGKYWGTNPGDPKSAEYATDLALYNELRSAVGLTGGGGGEGNTNDLVKVSHPTNKNPDGTPVLGMVKRSQLQAALAQGFKEIK